jgi:hypothetical protein
MSNAFKAVLGIAAFLSMSGATQAKQYCCSNPAICKAVCGAACCGQAFAVKAQQQEKQTKPALVAPVATKPQQPPR